MRPYPFLNPNAPKQPPSSVSSLPFGSALTAEQEFNKIVEEVMFSKSRNLKDDQANFATHHSSCPLHPIRPSKTCRQCKQSSKVTQPNEISTIKVV